MSTVLKGFIAATVLAGTGLAGAAPAQARYHHDNGSTAIVAGILGLGIGAAIASDHGNYGRSGSYYGYDSGPAYYAPAPVTYYGGDYYGGGYGYDRAYYGSYGYDRRDYGRGHRDWDRRGHDEHRGHHRDERGDRDYRR